MLSFKKFLGEDTSQSFYSNLIEDTRKLAMEHPSITPEHLQKMATTD